MARDLIVIEAATLEDIEQTWTPDDQEGAGRSRLMIYVLLAMLAAFAAWASLFEIDQSIRVEGQVIASQRIQQIQATQTGIVKKLWVGEGDRVKAGDMLMSIERDRQQAASIEAQSHLASLRLSINRLQAEVSGSPLALDPVLAAANPTLAAAQRELYERRREGLAEELRSIGDQLRLADEEYKMNANLFKTGDISRADLLRMERQVLDLRGQIVNRRNRFTQEAQAELARLEAERASQSQVQAERDVTLAHSDLRSPVNGLVNTVRAYTVGAVVREGEEVMQILPTDGELVIESKLRPADVANVRPGMTASIKLDAFDYTIYGTLLGTVREISPDAITVQTPRGEQTFFRVRVGINAEQINVRAQKILLRPGLEATIDIRSGRRTIMHYLTKPINRVFDESLNEK